MKRKVIIATLLLSILTPATARSNQGECEAPSAQSTDAKIAVQIWDNAKGCWVWSAYFLTEPDAKRWQTSYLSTHDGAETRIEPLPEFRTK